METLLISLLISFFIVIAAMVGLSYCKRRQRHGKHGLTGMCHQTGGAACSSCGGTERPDAGDTCRKTDSAV